MSDDDFAVRVAGLAALAEPVRLELYRYVVAQPDAVSRDQASEGVGVPRHTAKFHLDKLVEEGLLDTEFRRLSGRQGPGAGRPAKLYRRSGRELSVTLPDRTYQLAADLMASAIERAAADGSDVVEALRGSATEHGRAMAEQTRAALGSQPGRAGRAGRTAVLRATCATLAANGYEPRVQPPEITLGNCPFHALAQKHTELVCGMNLTLLSEMLELSADGQLSARLDPAEGRCCVTLTSA